MLDIMVPMLAGLTISLLAAASAASCASSALAVDVTSAADVQNLAATLACTGEGTFDITWYPSVTITQRIEVSNEKNVTVTGNGFPRIRGALAGDNGADAIVDAGSGTGIFAVSNRSTLRLNHLVLDGGNADSGGAVDVRAASSLFVFGCAFVNNNATNGGAISASTSAVYVTGNTSFDENSAINGGAIYLYGNSTMQVIGNTSFTNNHAWGSGGALYASTGSSLDSKGDSTFNNNYAGSNGGAIYLSEGSSLEIDGSTAFLFNSAVDDGGAMYASAESYLDIAGNSTLYNNSAGDDGGAIYLYGNSSMQLDGRMSFEVNSAGDDGGAVGAYTNVSVTINGDTSFVNNTAVERGGALYASTICSVDVNGDSVFDNNFGGLDGGAIFLFGGTSMDMDGSTSFLNNVVADDGGAIYMSTTNSMQFNGNTSFLNNHAGDHGGAVQAQINSSVIFNGDASFVKNKAKGHGGALYAFTSSSFEFVGSSIFDNNFAKEDGGAIYLYGGSSTQVDGSIYLVNNVCGDDGGAIGSYLNGSININGNALFVNNHAKETGGALYGSQSTAVNLVGNIILDNNLADIDGGAIYLYASSSVHTMGSTSFLNNIAGDDGGAISATEFSSVNFAGENRLHNNSALDNGGGLYIVRDSSANIDGNTLFQSNSARNSGGAMYVTESEMHTDGNTSVIYNSANSPGGGALFASQSDVNIDGLTRISHNSGYDGGAILAQDSEIHVTGNATFAYNAATRDGGAMKTTDSSVIIATNTQGVGLSSSNNLTRGLVETIVFIGNTAFDYGGAISIADPDQLNISDVVFVLNEAESGGALGLTSTSWATGDFWRCRFENNKGTRGGALYLDGEGQRILHDSSFRLNVAEETGGALFNAGALEIESTVFAENMATDGGLAIQSIETAVVLSNVTFDGNILACPSQTYSFTQDTSPGSCRFELACAQCLDGCRSDLSNVTIDRETLPTCESIPEGVQTPSTTVTLQTFHLKKGYFRISTESPIVLECYQKDACIGGIDPSDYCADGYSGPYCAVCTEGYAPGPSRRCHECSVENMGYTVGFCITVLLVVLFVVVLVVSHLLQMVGGGARQSPGQPQPWWRGKLSRFRKFLVKSIPLSAIRIVVVVLQIVIQFTEIAGAVYPDEYEAFLSALALVNFDIGSILSTSCLVTTDFYSRLVVTTLAPMVIILACGVTFLMASMRNRNVPSAGPIIKHRHVSVVLFMVFFVYSFVSFTIFQTFVCDSLDDGKAYLRADYSLTCDTKRHTTYLIYASVMVCVYPVGIPAFFAFTLVRNRQELEKPGRETVPHLKSYRCLWGAYKPSCYYYEVVECARRIVLTGTAVFVLPDTAEQVAIVLFFAVVFMFVSESLSPFSSTSDMWLYRWGNGIILASMYVALLLKVDLAMEGSQSSSAITVLLIGAHVFMIFTVAVQSFLLMRGMCASNVKEEPNPSPHWRTEHDAFGSELEASMNM